MIQQRLSLVRKKGFSVVPAGNDVLLLAGWRQFDDDRVTAFGHDKDLIRPDAYVLFYRHRHLPVNLRLEEQIISTHAPDRATISNL